MTRAIQYLPWYLVLPLCLACADNDILDGYSSGLPEGRESVVIDVCAPSALSASMTRAVSTAVESTLDGTFAVFAFSDANGEAGDLLFAVKTGDENTESNLDSVNNYFDDYGDYTDSPSIAWHPDPAEDDNNAGVKGRLYIEADETEGPIHLLVLANVDISAVAGLLEGTEPAIIAGMSLSEVTAALSPALDYAVSDANATYVRSGTEKDDVDADTHEYIPMSGECTLDDGITLGSTGSVSLRRSTAKISVSFSWERDFYGEDENNQVDLVGATDKGLTVFIPSAVKVVNIYRYATVYAGPSTELETDVTNTEANISSLNYSVSETLTDGSAMPITYDATMEIASEDFEYDVNGDLHVSVELLLAETLDSDIDAYTPETDPEVDPYPKYDPNENPRVSVLVCGTFYEYEANTGSVYDMKDAWYRLDLVTNYQVEGGDVVNDEIKEILRNHHYKFSLANPTKRPSSSELEALELSVPDNAVGEAISSLVVVEDEDIVSITADAENADETGVPYYIGVSSTSVDLPRSEGACAIVKMVTNYSDWHLDEHEIPTVEVVENGVSVDKYVFDIYYTGGSMYVWLDYPEAVVVGDTYAYFIVAGNIRKKMRINIVEGTYVDAVPG